MTQLTVTKEEEEALFEHAKLAPSHLIEDPWDSYPEVIEKYGVTGSVPVSCKAQVSEDGRTIWNPPVDRIARNYTPGLPTQVDLRRMASHQRACLEMGKEGPGRSVAAPTRISIDPFSTRKNPKHQALSIVAEDKQPYVENYFGDETLLLKLQREGGGVGRGEGAYLEGEYLLRERYWNFIDHRIKDQAVYPFAEEWMISILQRVVGPKIELDDELADDVASRCMSAEREVYLRSVKRSVLDYVLLDPAQRERLHLQPVPRMIRVLPANPAVLTAVPTRWQPLLEDARETYFQLGVYTTAPMIKLQAKWGEEFSTILLCKERPTQACSDHGVVGLELSEFDASQRSHCQEGVQYLSERWGSLSVNILRSDMAVNEVMNNIATDAQAAAHGQRILQRAFVMVMCLLRSVVTASLSKYREAFELFGDGTPPMEGDPCVPFRIIVKLQVEKDMGTHRFVCEPPLEKIVKTVQDCGLEMAEALNEIARIGTRKNRGRSTIKPIDLQEGWLKHTIARLGEIVERNIERTLTLRARYAEWQSLLDERTIDEIESFVAQTEDLEVLKTKIADLARKKELVMALSKPAELFNMFSVDCSAAKAALMNRIDELLSALLHGVATKTGNVAIALNEKYTVIDAKLRKPPTTDDALVEYKDYLQNCRREVRNCNIRLSLVSRNLSFLMEHHGVMEDKAQQIYVACFNWPGHVLASIIFAEKELKKAREEFETGLRRKVDEFERVIELFEQEVFHVQKFGEVDKVGDYVRHISDLEERFEEAKADAAVLNDEETKLEWPLSHFLSLGNAGNTLQNYSDFWRQVDAFFEQQHGWLESSLANLDPEEIEKVLINAKVSMMQQSKAFGVQAPAPRDAALECRERAATFQGHFPLIECCASAGMQGRHFEAVSKILGHPISSATLLRELLEVKGAHDMVEEMQEIAALASKEYKLMRALETMEEEWSPLQLTSTPYRETGTFVLSAMEDIQQVLDDQIIKVQSMGGSSMARAAFGPRIEKWEARLVLLQDVVDVWLQVQSVWMYLEPIFASADIRKQMPIEADLFSEVNQVWRKNMAKVQESPGVLHVLDTMPDILKEWNNAKENLEEIQRGLNAYLETKRIYFPRFFFLSNDELLEILSETKDPQRVQPHLKKCFEGINGLDFDKDGETILAMRSPEGEVIRLRQQIRPGEARGQVEVWLLQVEEEMKKAISAELSDSLAAYAQTEREEWILQWPGQCVLNVSQAFWTLEVERSLEQSKNKGLKEYEAVLAKQLMDVVQKVREKITKLKRITLGALVTLDVHSKDVVSDMARDGVDNSHAFEWLCQMRYYWFESNLKVRMLNAEQQYGYEYLGNQGRLVITPLTDRCYRTLMGALHLGLGGAPEGPAGTGKTETTKDLGKAVAKQCVVFNCSDGLDYLAMGKFFKGLASAGAWSCFDEFNRIDLEVLSVIATQILTIQNAVRAKLEIFEFEGSQLRLNWSCAVFITMNPGYAGRSELPDNLKALMRPCAMMVPDYAMIAEIILYSNGYLVAKDSARKIVATYRLCSEQLSSQDHYDYGMRAVISVLRAAGNLKRATEDEGVDENVLVLRSIVDVNLPKFLSQDISLFNGIVKDLFPGVSLPPPQYDELEEGLMVACNEMKLQPERDFFTKIEQLYEMINVRHGLMVVGDTDAGKSSMFMALGRGLGLMEERGLMDEHTVTWERLNPKSVHMGQLYGNFDPQSHEWTDGILANLYRRAAKDESSQRRWVVFDGPVDAIWIENMNTVLDDNKKLCLMSGEIIAMTSRMNMMYEPMDLAAASPATVSRVGIIYVEPHVLSWRPKLESWLQRLKEPLGEHLRTLRNLFQWMCPPSLKFLRRELKEPSPTQDIMLVTSCMKMFESVAWPEGIDAENAGALTQVQLEGIFLLSLTWSIGATVDHDGRSKMDEFLRLVARGGLQEKYGEDHIYTTEQAAEAWKVAEPMPEVDSSDEPRLVYDWSFNGRKWELWSLRFKNFRVDENAAFHQVIVPTEDSVRYTYLMETLLAQGFTTLFVGPTGTGKSVYAKQVLTSQLREGVGPIFIGFSAQTSAAQTQAILDSKLDKRRKGLYGPPRGSKYVVFVDDLNMPQVETYGAQPPIELLRQMVDNGGWYDWAEKGTPWKQIEDVTVCAAMAPPGGGRAVITPRLARQFCQITFTDLTAGTLRHIFSTLLKAFFTKYSFGASLHACTKLAVDATVNVYTHVSATLRPTPTKSHYLFNLRDVSRVIQGIMLVRPDQCETKSCLLRLWTHEAWRVFGDRMVDDGDKDWFHGKLRTVVKETWGLDFDKEFEALDPRPAEEKAGEGFQVEADYMRNLIWGGFLQGSGAEWRYDESPPGSAKNLVVIVEEFLKEYNSESPKPMSLVLFMFAIEHIARICRVLAMPKGHALLVGLGGSGRQSDARLASYISDCQVRQVEISKQYGVSEWREDLQQLLMQAGGKNVKSVFLFTDGQMKLSSFLEDVNNILNTGEVPNLFSSNEELAEIYEMVTPDCVRETGNADPTPPELYAFFLERVVANLHLILVMSPAGDAFRERLRRFPSLVNCCTIDWFAPWPEDALESVAHKFLAEVQLDESERGPVVESCGYFHQLVKKLSDSYRNEARRHNYVTPTSYLELIKTFKRLAKSTQSAVLTRKERYSTGLEKLGNAESEVGTMKEDLIALQPKLKVAQAETTATAEQVTKEKVEVVEPKKEVIQKDEEVAQAAADKAGAIKAECEADLAEAMPALHAAVKALDTLKKDDITFLKQLKKPPTVIRLVMQAVCVMFKERAKKKPNKETGRMEEDWWEPSIKLLSDMKFLDHLKDYDKDNIDPKVIDNIRKNFETHDDFNPEIAKGASAAAEGMCKWILAMSTYDRVAKVVAPKKLQLAAAEAEFSEVSTQLAQKRLELQEVLNKLSLLENTLKDLQEREEQLKEEVRMCEVKLDRAQKLIGGLGGEKVRWSEEETTLSASLLNVSGDVLLCAMCVAYMGPFTAGFRDRAMQASRKYVIGKGIKISAGAGLVKTVGDAVQLRGWVLDGLPADSFSAENAIMVQKASRWPLLVDPQAQANKWVRNTEAVNQLSVLKLDSDDDMRRLENAIQFGQPILIENIGETLEPTLEPVLLKQTFRQAGGICIRLGDTTLDYSSDFKLYMTTKLPNPHYLPEDQVKVALINFVITPAGLEDQLLGIVVAMERPDLEEEKNRLIVEAAQNKKELQRIEDTILEILSTSQGNILEDEAAINVLTDSKRLSDEIKEKQLIAEETEVAIDEARGRYQPVAASSSVMYFCITDLSHIDPMYQYSLVWFVNLFQRAIEDSADPEPDKSKPIEVKKDLDPADEEEEEEEEYDMNTTKKPKKMSEAQIEALNASLGVRIERLMEHFKYLLYRNVCRSLFAKDKLLFSLLLCQRLMESAGDVDAIEWRYLLTGGIGERNAPNPAEEWLTQPSWEEIQRFGALPAMVEMGFLELFEKDIVKWKDYFDSESPQTAILPRNWNDRLSPMQQCCVLRAIRPDKLVPRVSAFVSDAMGAKFTDPPPFSLAECYADSSPDTPLIFVLTPGSDPVNALLTFAKNEFDKTLDSGLVKAISLGQGQGPRAEAMIEEGRDTGAFVLLQNCHLATSWMARLEQLVEGFGEAKTGGDRVHDEFRLWLTSYPSEHFPVSVLQDGVKMVNEPAKGLRANMIQSLLSDPISDASFFEGCPKKQEWRKLIFGLVFFHAVIQERRAFGPIGWNIPYEFNESDLRISAQQLHMYLGEYDVIPFSALVYLTAQCNYGGRVTENYDRRTLLTILEEIYCKEIVTDGYKLSPSGSIKPLPSGRSDHQDMLSYVRGLPPTAHPEIFGMHANADISKDKKEMNELVSALLLTQSESSSSGGGGSGGRDDVVREQCAGIMGRIPGLFDVELVERRHPLSYQESMNTVLKQELIRYNRLLTVMRASLKSLEAAMRGEVVLSLDLDEMATQMYNNQIPTKWKKKSYPSLKPLAPYVTDFEARMDFFTTWAETGMPHVFWLSGIYFTHALLTGSLQNYARKKQIPIDLVVFDFEMLGTSEEKEVLKAPVDGIYVRGLYLEGARWNMEAADLDEALPKVLYSLGPVMWFKPCHKDEMTRFPHYQCPMYRTAERRGTLATTGHSTNFVMRVLVPSSKPEKHWIKRGVAILTSLSF